nr:putative reverse transcriptase domain-containing protein [Tanacetum cinerariifolium]
MSDSEHSLVTYTSVPSPVKDYSDIGSPEVDAPPSPDYVPGPEEAEQAPLSPDYVPGPEEQEQAPLSPDNVPGPGEPEQAPPSPVYLPYVPELVYPKYMPPEDDVFPAEEQLLPKRLRFASPTPSQEVEESSAAGAARQDEPAGVTAALAARDANRNGDDSHTSRMSRSVQVARGCTYPDFLKCQPLNFKGTERVVGLNAIEFATELMNKKINTWVERQADNKRKSDDTNRNNHQQPNKRQNTVRAYVVGNGDRRAYEGPRPLCTKCNYHHDGLCAPKCHKCNRFGHLSRDCRNPLNVNIRANQRGNVCFECGAQGHFKNECPKLKNNNNRGNQVGNAKAQAKVYAVGKAGANPDNNVVMGTFLLNNRYASILFDTDADRSFVSTAFSSRIVITPTALDYDYNVKLVDGRIVGLNTIILGCTLNFLNRPFNIDIIPVELGRFDVIIGMDWLTTYHVVIVYDEKIVRVPFGNETLIIRCDGSNNGTQLNIISCTKTRKYLLKGCPVFLENITTKTIKDKSKEKRLENVPIVRDWSEVFPEDLPGLPPTRQVEFQIDLIPS